MSMIATESKSIVTIPASTSKIITGVNVAGIIQSVIPAGIVGTIKPRDISMSHETARAAIGAKASPKAIIVGLSYLTLAYAYGQGKPETLTKGCPAWAAHGLTLACDYFKAGAGNVTVDALATAVQSAVDALLTLPKPAKAKAVNAPAITVPVIESKVDDDLTENQIDRINLSADIADKRAADNLTLATQAHVDAISEAEAKAKEHAESQKEKECVDVVRLIADMADKDQAITLIRAMAARFGYTLVSMDLPVRISA